MAQTDAAYLSLILATLVLINAIIFAVNSEYSSSASESQTATSAEAQALAASASTTSPLLIFQAFIGVLVWNFGIPVWLDAFLFIFLRLPAYILFGRIVRGV